jgi:hypothetical protein
VIWTVEPLWLGETCFILAGGPSLADVDLSLLRGQRTITINSSVFRSLEAGLDDGVLYFVDPEWFDIPRRREAVEKWRGLVVTPSTAAKKALPWINRIELETRRGFPPLNSPTVRRGRSSGQTCIALARALGATTVGLLGYDMQEVGGREHHHDDYRGESRDPGMYRNHFLPSFKGWNEDAKRAGVRVLNCTPDSALDEFEKVDMHELLQ